MLVRVNIRKATTKVRKERTFWCRGGEYLQRWKAIQKEYGGNTEEEWDVAYKRRVVSVAVSRKKKVAVDAIKSVVNGIFPS